jgi:hypothetical protein
MDNNINYNKGKCIIQMCEIDRENNIIINVDSLRCPLTQLIYKKPVVLSDGHTYEYDYVMEYIQKNKISPITREAVNIDEIYPNKYLEQIIQRYISLYPELKEEQYTRSLKLSIKRIRGAEKYEELFDFDDFDGQEIYELIAYGRKTFWKNDKLVKHVIDNLKTNINYEDTYGHNISHYLTSYANSDMMLYMFRKNIFNIGPTDGSGKPSACIYALNNATNDVVEYILDNQFDNVASQFLKIISTNTNISNSEADKLIKSYIKKKNGEIPNSKLIINFGCDGQTIFSKKNIEP